MRWGERGEQNIVLEPFDLVAVPADVRHSYKNIEPHTAHNIMTILPGKPSIVWAPAVVDEAPVSRPGSPATLKGLMSSS